MPRITVAGGPTNAAARPGEVGYIGPDAAATEDAAAPAPEAPAVPAAAQGTGPGTSPTPGPVPDYASMTLTQLREQAKERGLTVGGSKADLTARLAGQDPVAPGGES
jgi:hypothetical protein